MIVLYIFLGIILFIILLLCFPVKAIIQYSEFFSLEAEYLFLHFAMVPPDEKKKKKPKKIRKKVEKPKKSKKEKSEFEEEPEKKPFLKTIMEERGFSGAVHFIAELANRLLKIAGRFLRRIFSHVILEDVIISMRVAGKDAAKTAIDYGKLCSLVFPFMGGLCALAKVKKYDIDLRPDFVAKKSEAEIYARIYFCPIFAVGAAIAAAWSVLWAYLKMFKMKQKPDTKPLEKERTGISI